MAACIFNVLVNTLLPGCGLVSMATLAGACLALAFFDGLLLMMIDNYYLTRCPRLHKHMVGAALRRASAKTFPFSDNSFLMLHFVVRA